jgi:hypothetical protein
VNGPEPRLRDAPAQNDVRQQVSGAGHPDILTDRANLVSCWILAGLIVWHRKVPWPGRIGLVEGPVRHQPKALFP